MNFQCRPILEPIKVFVINPLAPASQLIIVKIMSGVVFGNEQLIDLNLIVYSNEMKSANAFKLEIESCAFSCTNSIKVSSDLPRLCDGDIFCYMTNLNNPNFLKFNKEELDEQFDVMYLMMKLANSFKWSDENTTEKLGTVKSVHFDKKETKGMITVVKEKRKPIFITDGLVAIDVIKTFSQNIPSDICFCPTPITAIARSVLGDYLSVQYNLINKILVWAANDQVFHVEVEKPLIVRDIVDVESQINFDVGGKDLLESMDSTQFSESWMKKEFIEKVASSASKNPYGCIYRAAEICKTLRDIWLTRDNDTKVYSNMGVISDGSLGTIKGYPYVLPLIFEKGVWSVNKNFEEETHLKQEIIKINKAVKTHHQQLFKYCKKFLHQHIINEGVGDEGSCSSY